jgi:hypothetical protein
VELVVRATAVTLRGAVGALWAPGVAACDGADAGEFPIVFVATTVKV